MQLLQLGFELLHILLRVGLRVLSGIGGGSDGRRGRVLRQHFHGDELHGIGSDVALGAFVGHEHEARAVLFEAVLAERDEAALDGRLRPLVQADGFSPSALKMVTGVLSARERPGL